MDVAMDVTGDVAMLLRLVKGEMARPAGLLEMTAPESPRSTRQRYRLTAKGRQWLKQTPAGGQA